MTRDQAMQLAREAGPLIQTPFDQWCENFARIVRNAALEEAAQKVEAGIFGHGECAQDIRNLKETS